MPVVPLLENTPEHEEAAYRNLHFYYAAEDTDPHGWIFPCTFCGLPTWQVVRLENKIIYLCKQCRQQEMYGTRC